MTTFKNAKKPINGNVPPDDFLDLLGNKIKELPGIAQVNPNKDIFTAIKPTMLEHQDGWVDEKNRQAWLMADLNAAASLESSYNWLDGKDPGANNTSPQTMESGIFQCSHNSIETASLYDKAGAKELEVLFTQHTGLKYSQSDKCGLAFIAQMKSDHEFAVEFMLKLMRITTTTHGPINRRTTNKYISIAAVKEFESFFREGVVIPLPQGLPPKPKVFQEMYQFYGNPQEKNWERDNIAFCRVPDSLTAFPFISSQGARGFYCNKRIVGQFQKVFQKVVDRKLQKTIYTFDGCWVVRYVRGSSTKLSNHSWGMAIDLDYEGNELGDTTPAIDMRLVACFEEEGFFCGGRYKGRKDWGHFDWSYGV